MFYGRMGKRYVIPKTELSNGSQGNLQIRMSDQAGVEAAQKTIGKTREGSSFNELDVEEEVLRMKGEPTEIVVIPYDYLDNWEYEIEIMTETVYQKGKSLDLALETEKLQAVSTLFPDIFMANKSKFFAKLMRQYGDSPENYDVETAVQQPQIPGQMPEGMQDLTAATKPLPALSGV